MSKLDQIKQKLADFEVKRQELLAEIQKDFPEIFKDALSESKIINSIGWRQYTVYFNDGDECYFSTYFDDVDYNIEVNGMLLEDLEGDEEEYKLVEQKWENGGYVPNPNYDEGERKILESIVKAIAQIDDTILKQLFGDHKMITIHKDGSITVEDYTDHD